MKSYLTLLFWIIPISASAQLPSDTSYSANAKSLKSNFIPKKVFAMSQLKHLYINGEDCDYKDATECYAIYKIPSEIKALKNLETLSLPQNAIKNFPEEIIQLKNLKVIDLTDNNLVDIDVLTSLENLQELYLYGCQLHKLPQDIGKLKNLKKLGLKGNYLSQEEIQRVKNELPKCEIIF